MISRDSPDYPGAMKLCREILAKYPFITRRQAYVMACVQIRPDRNRNSKFVGWDRKKRPVFQDPNDHYIATNKSGNPTEPDFPVSKEVPKNSKPGSAVEPTERNHERTSNRS